MAGTRYKLGDYQPYLYKTEDYGQSWKKITNGIPADQFTRVVRADPKQKGLLYAGTEKGLYISFDDGASWKPFQQNLPIVPITDLLVKQENLVVATQGRSLWIMDDLTPLYQLKEAKEQSGAYLYKPQASYRADGAQARNPGANGINHPGGLMVYFYLPSKPDSSQNYTLGFYTAAGDKIREFSTEAKEKQNKLTDLKAGLNRFVWDMRHEEAKTFDGIILWWADTDGPQLPPGEYEVRLESKVETQSQPFTLMADPRLSANAEDLQAQYQFLKEVHDKVSEAHGAIANIREVRSQLNSLKQRVADDSTYRPIVVMADSLNKQMTEVEETLYQTKSKSGQDPLNYPIQLTNKLAHLLSLYSIGQSRPPQQAYAFKEEVVAQIDAELQKWYAIRNNRISELNDLVRRMEVDAVKVPVEESK